MRSMPGVGFAVVWIIFVATVAAGCGEEVATTMPADITGPSTTVEQATANSALTPAHTPTPTVIPTATPVPPTPTPSQTYGEVTVSQLNWYTDEETDREAKGHLVLLLLEISENYPLLFEALIQKSWLNPEDVPSSFFRVNEAIDLLRRVADLTDGESMAITILGMPFLDSIDSDDRILLDSLGYMLKGRAEPFNAFLELLAADGGLMNGAERVDVYYAYMEAQDPTWLNRVFGDMEPRPQDFYVIGDMIELYAASPDIYFAVSANMNELRRSTEFVERVVELASLDTETAAWLARMPFNSVQNSLNGTVWDFMILAAKADRDSTGLIREKYEMEGVVLDHTNLALALMDAASTFAPDETEIIRSYGWVQDGFDGAAIKERNSVVYASSGLEQQTVKDILWAVHLNDAWVQKLIVKDWMKDTLTSHEEFVLTWLDIFSDPLAEVLLDMQFLHDVDSEDAGIFASIILFLETSYGEGGASFSEVLADGRIGGEITDANRHLVESVIDDVLERNGL